MKILQAREKDLMGLPIRRLLPARSQRTVGPWIFLDHMGPTTLAEGKGVDVPPHPHIGLATVTYLFEGAFLHRDSLGSRQTIVPGDLNWMTAGRGIVHSERSPDTERAPSRPIHGLQAWVALPQAHEEAAPSFAHHPRASLPSWREGGNELCLIAGEAYGHRSPVEVLSPLFYVEARLARGSELKLPDAMEECGVYVIGGQLSVAGEGLAAYEMGVFDSERPSLRAESPSHVVLLGGDRVGERLISWNFVSSSKERLERARDDWRAQRFDPVPGESGFMPLPERRG